MKGHHISKLGHFKMKIHHFTNLIEVNQSVVMSQPTVLMMNYLKVFSK